jgi:hypothetical protein
VRHEVGGRECVAGVQPLLILKAPPQPHTFCYPDRMVSPNPVCCVCVVIAMLAFVMCSNTPYALPCANARDPHNHPPFKHKCSRQFLHTLTRVGSFGFM